MGSSEATIYRYLSKLK
ncbi:hypothetical protein ACSOV7_11195 [Faecalibacterium prausnitzii]